MVPEDSSEEEVYLLESTRFIVALKSQQPWAMEQLFNTFEGPVYRFFFYSHGDSEQAQDDCANTFVTFMSAIQNFTGADASLAGFIFGIARNIRRHDRRPKPVFFEPGDNIDFIIDPAPSAFAQLSRQRDYQQAIQLMDQLNDPVREIMILRYVEELKISEISTALNMPENTVKSHLRRGCQKLKELMHDSPVNMGKETT